MISLKRKESGFTIVELLIVIVVIGILAALVVTTFSGIQRKARNSERQTDINAVASQLEAYHAQNGKYPTLANVQDNATDTGFVKTQLKGLDRTALFDPKGTTTNIAGTPAANVYAYQVEPAGCDNAAIECSSYTLTANREDEAAYVKKSLN